ncbi:MAG: tetraacyldisaccharide 4'-kinase [Gammaproteobacteria bacterium]
MILHDWLQRVWYGAARGGWVLIPLSWLFGTAVTLRRTLYGLGLLPARTVARPVVVVGNVTAGGTGKTPFVLWLAERLREEGLQVGIASRGYGGRASGRPVLVDPGDDPAIVGDEPLLMARRKVASVVVCRRRADAARELVAHGADVIICDDGLQHYRLARDLEVGVVDGRRRFGNGRLLPAGPMREPVSRLGHVDWVICNGGVPRGSEIGMQLAGRLLHSLRDGSIVGIEEFRGRRCHAVAGIGNPSSFFSLLGESGLDVIPHPLPDHATPRLGEMGLETRDTVIMTEKDAVKCRDGEQFDAWFLPVEARLDGAAERMVAEVRELCSNPTGRRG